MKKVLFVASTKLHIQMFHMPYIYWLMEQGIEVHILAGMDEVELDRSLRVIEVPFEKSFFSLMNWHLVAQIRELLETQQYDLISTHTMLASFFVRKAIQKAKNLKASVMTTVHGYLFDKRENLLKSFLLLAAEKSVANVTDYLVVMNDEDEKIATRYKLYQKELIKIAGMGLDLEKFCSISEEEKKITRKNLGIASDKKLLVYAAEFSSRKNHRMLIRVMKHLPEDVELMLLGNGKYFEKMKAYAFRKRVLERIHFMGKVSHTYPYLLLCDLAVSTSRYEGKPFHLMEAIATNLGIVVSDVKGNRELAQDTKYGALFPYKNEQAMVTWILELLKRDKNDFDGYECIAKKYSIQNSQKYLLPFYEKILEKNKSRK